MNFFTEQINFQQFKKTIQENARPSIWYFLLLIASIVIATAGLLTNNGPVIIGAMVIAPIWWPAAQLSLGIATLKPKSIRNGLLMLLASTLVALAVSTALAWIIPLTEVTDEIALRTAPTIIDLVIALAAGFVGVLAVFLPQIAAQVSGVAMALALVPPIAVTGIGLAQGRWEIVLASGLLYLANIGATVVASIITLYILGLQPRSSEEKVWSFVTFSFVVLIVLAISFPLTLYFQDSLTERQITKTISTNINDYVNTNLPQVSVGAVDITFDDTNAVSVILDLYVPENSELTERFQADLLEIINRESEVGSELMLRTISTTGLKSESQLKEEALEQQVREVIQDFVPSSAIRNIKTVHENRDASSSASVVLTLNETNQQVISLTTIDEMETALLEKLGTEIAVSTEIVPIRYLSQQQQQRRQQDVQNQIDNYYALAQIPVHVFDASLSAPSETGLATLSATVVTEEAEAVTESITSLENELSSDAIEIDVILNVVTSERID